MRKLFSMLLVFVLAFLITMPVMADQILPNIEEGNHYITILYGGGNGEQYWYSFDQDLEAVNSNQGEVFNLLTMEGFTPSRIYGWYRYNGSFSGNLDEYQDYIYGTEFRIGEDKDIQPFYIFANTEKIRLTSGPILDVGTIGIGARWQPINEFSASIVGQYDMFDTYIIKCSLDTNPIDELELNVNAWAILSDDDWGYWQVEALYPFSDNVDGIISYEQSTRTDGNIMIGVQYTL